VISPGAERLIYRSRCVCGRRDDQGAARPL